MGVPPFIIVPFSNGRTRVKMPRKRPRTPRVRLPGYPRSTCAVKAHTAPHVGRQAGLLALATLCHEFFNALLFSRNVCSIELLLIELLDD